METTFIKAPWVVKWTLAEWVNESIQWDWTEQRNEFWTQQEAWNFADLLMKYSAREGKPEVLFLKG